MRNEEKENKECLEEVGKENDAGDIFSIDEVHIEEMAIDGICGVY